MTVHKKNPLQRSKVIYTINIRCQNCLIICFSCCSFLDKFRRRFQSFDLMSKNRLEIPLINVLISRVRNGRYN